MADFRKLAPTPQYAVKGTRVVEVDPLLRDNIENRAGMGVDTNLGAAIRLMLGGVGGRDPDKPGDPLRPDPQGFYASDLDPKYDKDTPLGMQLGRGDVAAAGEQIALDQAKQVLAEKMKPKQKPKKSASARAGEDLDPSQ